MNIEHIVKKEFDEGLKSGRYTLGFYDDILIYEKIKFNKTDLKEGRVIIDVVYTNYLMNFSFKDLNSHYPRIDGWYSKTFSIDIKPQIRVKKLNRFHEGVNRK